jgi:hypothetical protein
MKLSFQVELGHSMVGHGWGKWLHQLHRHCGASQLTLFLDNGFDVLDQVDQDIVDASDVGSSSESATPSWGLGHWCVRVAALEVRSGGVVFVGRDFHSQEWVGAF